MTLGFETDDDGSHIGESRCSSSASSGRSLPPARSKRQVMSKAERRDQLYTQYYPNYGEAERFMKDLGKGEERGGWVRMQQGAECAFCRRRVWLLFTCVIMSRTNHRRDCRRHSVCVGGHGGRPPPFPVGKAAGGPGGR